MSFRQIADNDMFDIAQKVMEVRHTLGLLRFAQEVYGNEAYQVLVQTDNDGHGDYVSGVEVTDQQSCDVMPDFTLPFWQAWFEPGVWKPTYEVSYGTVEEFKEDLNEIKAFLRIEGIYSTYTIDPDDEGEVICLDHLTQTHYPELYRKE